jgi:hypothetical protein
MLTLLTLPFARFLLRCWTFLHIQLNYSLSLSLSLSHAGNPFSHPAFCVSAAAALTSYFYCYDYDNYYLGHPFPHPAVRASATAVPYSDHFLRFFVLMFLLLLLSQDIHFHILHYVSPLQRHYIRILWMIPIYAIESWLALRFNNQKIYLETMREAYEAYVVYSFFKLMRDFLGDKKEALKRLKRIQQETGQGKANKIMHWYLCPPAWRLDSQFLTRSALGVYQYVVVRTLSAGLACILEQVN